MIPFNKPYLTGNETKYIHDAHSRGQLAGDGYYTKLCHAWLEDFTGASKALLTHSCTAALEIAALLLDIKPGDEVIMPSYTFVSTANAFVLRGATPIFVDISPSDLNIDPLQIEQAISSKTKAIVVVHYAGVSCDMGAIQNIAEKNSLFLVEDAAQGLMAFHHSNPLGSIGDIGCFSFHETKNIICGEGGAIVVNNKELASRAEILREKGTNRSSFFRGEVDKYTWVDIGSSYLPGELNAAFLYAQLQSAHAITTQRLQIWLTYHDYFSHSEWGKFGLLTPSPPSEFRHNGHIYYLLFPSRLLRDKFIAMMQAEGVHTVFHYIPLHNSPAGLIYSSAHGTLPVTESVAQTLVRLPIYLDLDVDCVISKVDKVLSCLFL